MTLVETKTVTGTLAFGDETPVRAILDAGSGQLTWLPEEGATVERGQPLFAIDGQPVVVFYGKAPLFRTLTFSDDAFESFEWYELTMARDSVRQAELSADLARARLAEAEDRAAVASDRLADSQRGEPRTAQLINLRGALRVAQRRLEAARRLSGTGAASHKDLDDAERTAQTAQAALDDAIQSDQQQADLAKADAASARVQVLTADRALEDARRSLDAMQLSAGDMWDIALLKDNLAALGYHGPAGDAVRGWQTSQGLPATGRLSPARIVVTPGPVRVAERVATVGDVVVDFRRSGGLAQGGQSLLLRYTETARQVVVLLSVADRGFAAVGREAIVTLPGGAKVKGEISKVGATVSEKGETKVTIAISDQEALGGLEAASVDVKLESEKREGVLSAPVEALLARPEGGFGVEVVEGGRSRIVRVQTGMFANGRVEISGDGIAAGLRVGVPR
jgi:multidrug efflux pump subunit AcrA (membrane-fusion protein)